MKKRIPIEVWITIVLLFFFTYICQKLSFFPYEPEMNELPYKIIFFIIFVFTSFGFLLGNNIFRCCFLWFYWTIGLFFALSQAMSTGHLGQNRGGLFPGYLLILLLIVFCLVRPKTKEYFKKGKDNSF